MIKIFQPQGLYGERDIHRRPFEACSIPQFNKENSEHISLSKLGKECRKIMEKMAPKMRGEVGRMRTFARKNILSAQLSEINKIVSSILKKQGQIKPIAMQRKKKKTIPSLFDD